MKFRKIVTLLAVLAVLLAGVSPAYAQLGDTDVSSFTIQNIDTSSATVRVQFVDESGAVTEPATLNGSQTNPFTLEPGAAFEVYVPGIPATELPSGRYSVVISSSAQVVAIANLVGSGNINFNGSYSGFSAGATNFYLPSFTYNYYKWYSLISVQNVGTEATDIEVTIACENGTTGTLTFSNLAANASHHFDLTTDVPTGFTAGSTSCNGSAQVASHAVGTSDPGQPVVAVDNQRVPTAGNTQSFSGVVAGAGTLYAPALYKNYYSWNGSLNIRKLDAGATTVTVTYSDSGTSTCDLTDATPGCLLYMPSVHPGDGVFAATITSSPAMNLVAVINAANGSQAQTYNGIGSGTETVGIPSVMKSYFGWDTSITCQNVGTVATSIMLSYAGYTGSAYDSAVLQPGDNFEKVQKFEAFLPSKHQGGLTVTANTAGSQIACIVNFVNDTQIASTAGDWSMSYNAFNK